MILMALILSGLLTLIVVLALFSDRYQKKHTETQTILLFGNLVPPLTLTTLLITFCFSAWLLEKEAVGTIASWTHKFGIFSLSVFLMLGQYFQIQSYLHRSNPLKRRGTIRRWFVATALMPAPAALTILISGFAQIYSSSYSMLDSWLFYLVALFVVMFLDGIMQYRPHVFRLYYETSEPGRQGFLKSVDNGILPNALIFVHFASLSVVFYLVIFKPDLPHPLFDAMRIIQLKLFDSRLLTSIIWALTVAGAYFLVRTAVKLLAPNSKSL